MKKLLSIFLLSIMSFSLISGCNGNSPTPNSSVQLPDFPSTPDDGRPSWEHDNEPFSITWYVNTSWFNWTSNGTDVVSKVLKEKTGVSIKFITPVTDNGELLATMIASDNLPDVVSIQAWYPQITQLASQGYLYALDDLIDKWAPSFRNHIQQDVWDWFKQADGKTYGVPNFAYSKKYLEQDEQMQPNGAILVREDWYYEVESQGIDMTTPSGFIEGAKYIKNKYSNSIPIQLDNFDLEGNPSINWLAQYFAIPFEKDDGSYQYPVLHPRYLEMLEFLNEAYRNDLISDANFSANTEQVKRNLATGNVFISMATPQDFSQSFYSSLNKGIKYIPLVLRNKDGDAPVLQDIRGMGFLLSMITKNASRPDKIIKVFEYLYSEEGQRLVAFGQEGDSWEWANEEKTKIKWTDKYLKDLDNDNVGQYGLYQMNLLMNTVYIDKLKPLEGMTDVDIYINNLKRPLTPYSYDYTPNFLKPVKPDADDPEFFNKYFKVSTKENNITQTWAQYLPEIIRSKSKEQVKTNYDAAIKDLKRRGLDEVVAFYDRSYQLNKKILGIDTGWPPFKDNYQEPSTGPNGDFSYWEGATYERPN